MFPVLCLGLYRSKRWETHDPALDETALLLKQSDFDRPAGVRQSAVRFVYTNPPPHEPLQDNDLVFVLAMDDFVEDRWKTLDANTPLADVADQPFDTATRTSDGTVEFAHKPTEFSYSGIMLSVRSVAAAVILSHTLSLSRLFLI